MTKGSVAAVSKKKSWREELAGHPRLPEVKPIPERMQQRHGQGTIVMPSPQEVEEAMRRQHGRAGGRGRPEGRPRIVHALLANT